MTSVWRAKLLLHKIILMEREPQVSIAWRNLTRKVSHLNHWQWRKKTILQRQSGHCLAGSLTGLLGASGSGMLLFTLFVLVKKYTKQII